MWSALRVMKDVLFCLLLLSVFGATILFSVVWLLAVAAMYADLAGVIPF